MPITKDHLKIVEVISREIVKLVLVGVAIYAFLTLLHEFVKASDLTIKLSYGAGDSLFGVIIYKMIDHYFPSKK